MDHQVQLTVAMMTGGSILRTLANLSGSALTGPKQVVKELRRKIYSKPPRNKIGAAVSSNWH